MIIIINTLSVLFSLMIMLILLLLWLIWMYVYRHATSASDEKFCIVAVDLQQMSPMDGVHIIKVFINII